MRAIIITTGTERTSQETEGATPSCYIPLVDRPFLQHLIERLVDQGLTRFDFVLDRDSAGLQFLLGNGRRWGSDFRYHLADPGQPYGCLREIAGASDDGALLLADAHTLPGPALERLIGSLQSDQSVALTQKSTEPCWIGWAVLNRSSLASLSACTDSVSMREHLLRNGRVLEADDLLSIRSYVDLIAAQKRVMDDEFGGLLPLDGRLDNGVRRMKGARIHPSARLQGPLFLGENSRIGAGVELGPNVVIGSNCVIDRQTRIDASLICPNSYVGMGLSLENVVLNGNRLIHIKSGTALTITEPFLAASIHPRS